MASDPLQAANTSWGTAYVLNAEGNPMRPPVLPPQPPVNTGGGGGDMGNWVTSVEQRLGDLRADYRNLLIGGLIGAATLIGAGWIAYRDILTEVNSTNVSVSQLRGEVMASDAKLDGKLDLLIERTNDNSTRSNRTK